MALSVIELCAGAGGQATGLESAGFEHEVAVDNDHAACQTLRINRPRWHVIEADIATVDGTRFRGIDLLAGGVPCPPFSIASRQLGAEDERDLFPEALRLITEARPRAVMLENVKGLASTKFAPYRQALLSTLSALNYYADWKLLNASDYGVPQLRPRFVLVALQSPYAQFFSWPAQLSEPRTVGSTLKDLMAARGWIGATEWSLRANRIAPTIVGGSKKHGGPDLGPTRARREWLALGVNGKGLADDPPGPSEPADYVPKLTLRMVARLQGFADTWSFEGSKTAAYRQIGNAFPPPVAQAVGTAIRAALESQRRAEAEVQLPLVLAR